MSSGTIKHSQYRGCQGGSKYSFKFNGLEGVLSCALSPIGRLCLEIHRDKSEDWYFCFEANVTENKHSFL